MNATSCAGRLLAIFCALLFAVALAAWTAGLATEWVLLRPETHKQNLLAERVYERLPAALAETAGQNAAPFLTGFTGFAAGFQGNPAAHLTAADYQFMLETLLQPSWLQTEAESVIDQLFTFINSDQPQPVLRLSLLDPKQRLAGPAGRDILLHIIRAQPACTTEQIIPGLGCAGWLAATTWCSPPEAILADCTVALDAAAFGAALSVPDEVELVSLGGGDMQQLLHDVRSAAQSTRWSNRLGWIIVLALLIAVGVFGARSWRGLAGWWGLALAMGAITLLPAAFLLWFFPGQIVGRLLAFAPPVVLLAPEIPFDVGRALLQQLAFWLAGGGLFAGLAALGLLLFALLLPGRERY